MTESRFVTVSGWMKNGNILEFLKDTNADRLQLVFPLFRIPLLIYR